MKQIAAFLLVLIGLGIVVFNFEPAEPPRSTDDMAIYQINPEPSERIATVLNHEEAKKPERSTSHMLKKLDKTQKDKPAYATTSDPSIQTLDPDIDPVNEIKKL